MIQSALLGIDLGAGSLKATVISAEQDGAVLSTGAHPVDTHIPQPGWSEQNPVQWYDALCVAVKKALAQNKLNSISIRGIAISAGAHIPVLLDKHDAVIRPAIMWNDQRSAAQVKSLHEQHGDLILETSLNKANPTWSLAMLRWLQEQEPDNIARVRKLCMAKDYLRYRLTGEWATDFGDVIGALMGDVNTSDWSQEICQLISWSMGTLPQVKNATDKAGSITKQAAEDTGLASGTPVVVGSIDTSVELLGAGVVEVGQASIKLATAGVLSLVAKEPVLQPPISCYPHLVAGRYYLASGTNSCASAHQWACDQFFNPESLAKGETTADAFDEMDKLVAGVVPGCDGLLFHPYLQGERAPYWDPDLRADFIGLTMQHTRAHIARAVYEGIAFSIRDLMQDATEKGLEILSARLIGGGARSATWSQIMTDVTGLDLEIPVQGDASFGSALVAGIGVGEFDDANDAIKRCVKINNAVEPDKNTKLIYDELFSIYRDAQQTLAPINHRLAALHCPGI